MASLARSEGCIAVLGAGITGLTVAAELARRFGSRVIVLEKEAAAGGLASTFAHRGFVFDTGSHRIHEDCEPRVRGLLKELCGPDLLQRPRQGLLFLNGSPIAYPPSAIDVLLAFGVRQSAVFLKDFVATRCARSLPPLPDNFEAFVTRHVGRSLYDRFYRPYATKLYGVSPEHIAPDPAEMRVRKFTPQALWRDVSRKLRGKHATYWYPSHGIGQIAAALQRRLSANSGRIEMVCGVRRLRREHKRIEALEYIDSSGVSRTIQTAVVISTIPIDVLHSLICSSESTSAPVTSSLRWRSLRILYLITADTSPRVHEAFYFPEADVPFGRVSELRKYSPLLNNVQGRMALAIEIPCSYGDETWSMPDDVLARQCKEGLRRYQLLNGRQDDDEVFSLRIRTVYPMYEVGWREHFSRLRELPDALSNLYMIGRTALFLHCNIDHCIHMALRLSDYLKNDPQGKAEWATEEAAFFDYRVRE